MTTDKEPSPWTSVPSLVMVRSQHEQGTSELTDDDVALLERLHELAAGLLHDVEGGEQMIESMYAGRSVLFQRFCWSGLIELALAGEHRGTIGKFESFLMRPNENPELN